MYAVVQQATLSVMSVLTFGPPQADPDRELITTDILEDEIFTRMPCDDVVKFCRLSTEHRQLCERDEFWRKQYVSRNNRTPATWPDLDATMTHTGETAREAFREACQFARGRQPRTLEGHQEEVIFAVFSPDDATLITTSYDTTSKLWRVSDGQLLHTLVPPAEHGYSVVAAFSPDNTMVVTGGPSACLWSVVNGQLLYELHHFGDQVSDVEFSPDGTKLLIASGDGHARMFDVASRRLLLTVDNQEETIGMHGAKFSPDGTKFVTSAYGGHSKLWGVAFGNLLHALEGHGDNIAVGRFSPDGTKVVTASYNNIAEIFRVEDGSLLHTLRGHTDVLNSAVFSRDGATVLTGSSDRTARMWSADDGHLLRTFGVHPMEVMGAHFSPDGAYVLTESDHARLWRVGGGEQELPEALDNHLHPLYSATFSNDGALIVTTSEDNTAKLWASSRDA